MSVGTDLAQKWSAKGAAFFTSYWWALMIALALFYGIHLGVRRLYRVKRRDGYESIGPTVMGAGHRFNTDSASARDGFEQALMQDDSSDDSDRYHGFDVVLLHLSRGVLNTSAPRL